MVSAREGASQAAAVAWLAWAQGRGATPAQVVLAWLLARVPISGTTSVGHLEENLAALNLELWPEEIAELEGYWPPRLCDTAAGQVRGAAGAAPGFAPAVGKFHGPTGVRRT